MKKLVVLAVLSSIAVFAAQKKGVCYECIEKMRAMEQAMATIQKGFLYNHEHVVANGVKSLKEAVKHSESFLKHNAKQEGINTPDYAQKQSEEIKQEADALLKHFQKGDQYNAANSYLKILSKCLSCHYKMRKW